MRLLPQLLNSEIVRWRGFGEQLLKEDVLDPNKVLELINRMLADSQDYKNKIDLARTMFRADPASRPDKFLFYVNMLGEHGTLAQEQRRVGGVETKVVAGIVATVLTLLYAMCPCCLRRGGQKAVRLVPNTV